MNRWPEQKLDKQSVTLWRIDLLILFFIQIIVFGLVSFGIVHFTGMTWIYLVFATLVLFFGWVMIVYYPQTKYARWAYEVRDEEIDLAYGIWFSRRLVIPMAKIQHVDTIQGPIMRQLHVKTVTFATAAGTHSIPVLNAEMAETIREKIATLARMTDDEHE